MTRTRRAALPFASADEALRWMRAATGAPHADVMAPWAAYRQAARLLHPDVGGDPAQWARLDEARRLLADAGLMNIDAGACT